MLAICIGSLAKRTMLPFKASDGVSLAETIVGQNRYDLRWWCATKSDGTWLPLTEVETQLVPHDETLASITEHIIVLTVFKNGVPSFHRSAESRHFADRANSGASGDRLLRAFLNLT